VASAGGPATPKAPGGRLSWRPIHDTDARAERGYPTLLGPMVANDPSRSAAPCAPESARPGRTGSGLGLRARMGGARQGLLEPGPECRWDHVSPRGGLFPARAGARLVG